MSLRICHLGKYYPPAPGGIETHVRTLAEAQAVAGDDVRVICINHRDSQGQNVTGNKLARTPTVEHDDSPVRVTRVGRYASLARFDVSSSIRPTLKRVFRQPIDVLHLHVPNPTMLLTLATMKLPAPLVIGYHSDVVRQRLLWLAQKPIEDRIFKSAHRILVGSAGYWDGSPVLRRYSAKVDLLPYGVDLRPFLEPSAAALEFTRELRREHGQPLWLSVGRLVYYKGLHVGLEALKHVPGKLLIVGTGPLRGELERHAQSLGVADRVIWAGHLDQDQLAGAYHAATALWFPSIARSESFGMVQVEAMASGCPVINTQIDGSGVPWVSLDGQTGCTVAIGDAHALAAAAHRILNERELQHQVAAGSRQRAVSLFDQSGMVERCAEIYAEVLGSSPPTLAAKAA